MQMITLVEPKNDDIEEYLACQICLAILIEPVECKLCENAYCKKCLEDWTKKNPNECPNRCKPLQAGPIHRVFKTLLEKLRVKCPNAQCSYSDTYGKIFNHIK